MAETVVREARSDDVDAICRFGAAHVPGHCGPLLGAAAADDQVRRWWNPEYIGSVVDRGLVLVGEADGEVVGVAQHGRNGDEHVVHKMYVHPGHRSGGLGARLMAALLQRLPADAVAVGVEQFAVNARAGAFYEREGFAVREVVPGAGGDPALAVVRRVRQLV